MSLCVCVFFCVWDNVWKTKSEIHRLLEMKEEVLRIEIGIEDNTISPAICIRPSDLSWANLKVGRRSLWKGRLSSAQVPPTLVGACQHSHKHHFIHLPTGVIACDINFPVFIAYSVLYCLILLRCKENIGIILSGFNIILIPSTTIQLHYFSALFRIRFWY